MCFECIGCRQPDTYCVLSCPHRDAWDDEPDDRGNDGAPVRRVD